MLIREALSTSFGAAVRRRYTHVTLCSVTLWFFFLALVTCIIQSTLQGLTLHASSQGMIFVTDIINTAGVQRGFTAVHGNVLEICFGIPNLPSTSCDVVYNGTADSNHITSDTSDALHKRGVSMVPYITSNGTTEGVILSNLGSSSPSTALSLQCVKSLTWLETFLRNAMSEDIIHITFQCWLFCISLAALITESIPQLVVVLASHGANTGWTLFRLGTDGAAEKTYKDVVVGGACNGVDVLGGWRGDNLRYAIIAINCSVFLCMIFIVYKLAKVYGRGVFSSVGSSPVVTRVLKLTHWLTVFLQFTSFYIVASAAAWYDKRKTGVITPYSNSTLQDVAFVVIAVLVLPWFSLGLRFIQLEHRLLFLGFALLSTALLTISGLWFSSALYRYELGAWTFLGAISVLADFLLLVTCVLALICRMRFGLGLKQFLQVQAELRKAGFAQDRFVLDPNSETATMTSITAPINMTTKIKMLGESPSVRDRLRSMSTSRPQSTCSAQSETFETWLVATEKYGPSDEEKAWTVSPLTVLGPTLPPGMGSASSPVLHSELQPPDSRLRGDNASSIVVRETAHSTKGFRGEPAFKARL